MRAFTGMVCDSPGFRRWRQVFRIGGRYGWLHVTVNHVPLGAGGSNPSRSTCIALRRSERFALSINAPTASCNKFLVVLEKVW